MYANIVYNIYPKLVLPGQVPTSSEESDIDLESLTAKMKKDLLVGSQQFDTKSDFTSDDDYDQNKTVHNVSMELHALEINYTINEIESSSETVRSDATSQKSTARSETMSQKSTAKSETMGQIPATGSETVSQKSTTKRELQNLLVDAVREAEYQSRKSRGLLDMPLKSSLSKISKNERGSANTLGEIIYADHSQHSQKSVTYENEIITNKAETMSKTSDVNSSDQSSGKTDTDSSSEKRSKTETMSKTSNVDHNEQVSSDKTTTDSEIIDKSQNGESPTEISETGSTNKDQQELSEKQSTESSTETKASSVEDMESFKELSIRELRDIETTTEESIPIKKGNIKVVIGCKDVFCSCRMYNDEPKCASCQIEHKSSISQTSTETDKFSKFPSKEKINLESNVCANESKLQSNATHINDTKPSNISTQSKASKVTSVAVQTNSDDFVDKSLERKGSSLSKKTSTKDHSKPDVSVKHICTCTKEQSTQVDEFLEKSKKTDIFKECTCTPKTADKSTQTVTSYEDEDKSTKKPCTCILGGNSNFENYQFQNSKISQTTEIVINKISYSQEETMTSEIPDSVKSTSTSKNKENIVENKSSRSVGVQTDFAEGQVESSDICTCSKKSLAQMDHEKHTTCSKAISTIKHITTSSIRETKSVYIQSSVPYASDDTESLAAKEDEIIIDKQTSNKSMNTSAIKEHINAETLEYSVNKSVEANIIYYEIEMESIEQCQPCSGNLVSDTNESEVATSRSDFNDIKLEEQCCDNIAQEMKSAAEDNENLTKEETSNTSEESSEKPKKKSKVVKGKKKSTKKDISNDNDDSQEQEEKPKKKSKDVGKKLKKQKLLENNHSDITSIDENNLSDTINGQAEPMLKSSHTKKSNKGDLSTLDKIKSKKGRASKTKELKQLQKDSKDEMEQKYKPCFCTDNMKETGTKLVDNTENVEKPKKKKERVDKENKPPQTKTKIKKLKADEEKTASAAIESAVVEEDIKESKPKKAKKAQKSKEIIPKSKTDSGDNMQVEYIQDCESQPELSISVFDNRSKLSKIEQGSALMSKSFENSSKSLEDRSEQQDTPCYSQESAKIFNTSLIDSIQTNQEELNIEVVSKDKISKIKRIIRKEKRQSSVTINQIESKETVQKSSENFEVQYINYWESQMHSNKSVFDDNCTCGNDAEIKRSPKCITKYKSKQQNVKLIKEEESKSQSDAKLSKIKSIKKRLKGRSSESIKKGHVQDVSSSIPETINEFDDTYLAEDDIVSNQKTNSAMLIPIQSLESKNREDGSKGEIISNYGKDTDEEIIVTDCACRSESINTKISSKIFKKCSGTKPLVPKKTKEITSTRTFICTSEPTDCSVKADSKTSDMNSNKKDDEDTTSNKSSKEYRCSCPNTTSKSSGSKIIYDYTFK